jgi:hypothetical protein
MAGMGFEQGIFVMPMRAKHEVHHRCKQTVIAGEAGRSYSNRRQALRFSALGHALRG